MGCAAQSRDSTEKIKNTHIAILLYIAASFNDLTHHTEGIESYTFTISSAAKHVGREVHVYTL